MSTEKATDKSNAETSSVGRGRHVMDDEAIQKMIEGTLSIDESAMTRAFRPLHQIAKLLFRPKVLYRDNLPTQPVMFVGNHSTLAMDAFVLAPLLQQELGRFPRALGDDFLFAQRHLADFFTRIGGVVGHEKICSALMENGKDMVVFPGGAHEANKPVRDRYTLRWKQRTGFIRLAAKHGYTIVPLGLVGPDEWFDRYVEPEDFYDTQLGQLLIKLGMPENLRHPDITPPILKGLFGTPLPKPVSCYLGIGKPLDLSDYKGRELTARQQSKLRKKVSDELEVTIAKLLLIQAQEKSQQGLIRRLLTF